MASRTDIHRPSIADPAEYREVGYADLHPDAAGGSWWEPGFPGVHPFFHGHFDADGHCDHCGTGSRLRYATFYFHEPTGEILTVGDRCAVKLGLASRSAAQVKRLREQAVREAQVGRFAQEQPEAFAFIAAADEGGRESYPFGSFWGERWSIVTSMGSKLRRYGSLSEKQVAFLARIREDLAEAREKQEERKANAVPVVEGAAVKITGKVISTKWADGYMGDSVLKMLVEDDRGFRVYGTVPKKLADDEGSALVRWPDGREERLSGQDLYYRDEGGEIVESDEGFGADSRVSFTAQVERSSRDESFGFFKRPTKAARLDTVHPATDESESNE